MHAPIIEPAIAEAIGAVVRDRNQDPLRFIAWHLVRRGPWRLALSFHRDSNATLSATGQRVDLRSTSHRRHGARASKLSPSRAGGQGIPSHSAKHRSRGRSGR